MLRTVCRYVAHVNHHAAIVPTVLEAARDITSGRPQPGAIEVPIDLQYATGEVRVGEPHPPSCRRLPRRPSSGPSNCSPPPPARSCGPAAVWSPPARRPS